MKINLDVDPITYRALEFADGVDLSNIWDKDDPLISLWFHDSELLKLMDYWCEKDHEKALTQYIKIKTVEYIQYQVLEAITRKRLQLQLILWNPDFTHGVDARANLNWDRVEIDFTTSYDEFWNKIHRAKPKSKVRKMVIYTSNKVNNIFRKTFELKTKEWCESSIAEKAGKEAVSKVITVENQRDYMMVAILSWPDQNKISSTFSPFMQTV